MSYLTFLFRKTQMEPIKFNFKIRQGTTFSETFRWESSRKKYARIATIDKSAPVAITTTDPHEVLPGWRFKVSSAQGMKEINSSGDTWYTSDPVLSTTSVLVINDINSIGFSTHTADTGVIEFFAPAISGPYTALMQIRAKLDSQEVLLELSTTNGMIEVDQATSTIKISIPDSVTRDLSFQNAVYSLELRETGTNRVIPFLTGSVSVIKDATAWPIQVQP